MTTVIGLTGGIASGKSTITDFLQQQNIPVIDADQLVNEFLTNSTSLKTQLRQHFGEAIIKSDGQVDRAQLARIVFVDAQQRRLLEHLIHPYVFAQTNQQLYQFRQQKKPLVFIVAPLLIETQMHHLVDQTWVISLDREIQIARLMTRDHLDQTAAQQRLAAQLTDQERLQAAQVILTNNDSPATLIAQVQAELAKLAL